MQTTRRTTFPPAALDWATGGSGRQVLVVGGGTLARLLQRRGHRVFCVDQDLSVAEQLSTDNIEPVVAKAEALPFDPCQFDVVAVHQVFHKFAPGLALSEFARVVKPGGHVAVSYLVRDDSVPWVRRLIARVRQDDPEAMAGAFGADSVEHLMSSKYFPRGEHKAFRIWTPMSVRAMTAMVRDLPGVQALDASQREALASDVSRLCSDAATGTGDLSLPYLLKLWRAEVDHAELTAPINVPDDGLVIQL